MIEWINNLPVSYFDDYNMHVLLFYVYILCMMNSPWFGSVKGS